MLERLLHWLHEMVLAVEAYLPAFAVARWSKPFRRWTKERRRARKDALE